MDSVGVSVIKLLWSDRVIVRVRIILLLGLELRGFADDNTTNIEQQRQMQFCSDRGASAYVMKILRSGRQCVAGSLTRRRPRVVENSSLKVCGYLISRIFFLFPLFAMLTAHFVHHKHEPKLAEIYRSVT